MATMDTSSNKESTAMNKEESTIKTIEDSTTNNGDKKEEEIGIKSEEELLSSALKLMESDNYNSAVLLLSNAMELIQKKNNSISIESVKYYMAYGEALLRLIQSCNDLFAAPIREKQQQYIAEEQEEEAPVLINDAVTDPEDTENDKNKINSKEEEEDEEDEDEDDDLAPNEVEREAVNGDIDTSEDREIAWETLEYARTIIEDYLKIKENENDNEKIKMLSMVHSFLGELMIEDEQNEMALKEFEKALNVQNKCKNGIIKYRQKAFNHFMACLAAQFLEKNDEALKHCNIALNGLTLKIKYLLKEFKCNQIIENEEKKNEEIKYDELMKIAQGFMEKMDETQKNNENGKELKDLIDLMTDLMDKMDEVKEIMELKKNNKNNNNNNDNNNDGNGGIMNLMNCDDPLSALINGLTQKFGINEEELAQLDENKNIQNDDEDKNEGITTFGFGGNNNDNDDDEDDDVEVNDLGSFGGKKKKEEKEVNTVKKTVNSRKKRSLEEAEIDDGLNGNVKRMKLNSGVAAVPVIVENEDKK